MSGFKKLAGQTAIFGLSTILGRLVNYLLVPIHTAAFARAEFGVVTEIYAYVAFLNVVYTFGMETTFFRFGSRYAEERDQYFSQAFWWLAAIGGTLTLLLTANASTLVNSLGYAGKEVYVYWMATTMLIDGLVSLPIARLRLEGRPWYFLMVRFSAILLNVALNAFFMLLAKPASEGAFGAEWQATLGGFYNPEIGVGYVFLANLLSNAVMVPLVLPLLKKVRFNINKDMLRQMLVYSWPLLFMGLAGMTDEMLSRAILKHYLPADFYPYSPKDALGVFGACYKLSIFMSLAIQAFRYAADPFFFDKAQDKNAPEVFAKVMHAFVLVCLLLFLGVSLNLWWLAPLFVKKAEYLVGLEVVPPLLLANMLLGVYYNLTVWFKITDKTHFSLWLSLLGVFITVVGNVLLIPILGYMGSAYTTLVCYLLMSVACYALGQKYWPIPYRWGRTLMYLALTLALWSVFSYGIEPLHWPLLSLGYTLAAVLGYAAVAFKFEKWVR